MSRPRKGLSRDATRWLLQAGLEWTACKAPANIAIELGDAGKVELRTRTAEVGREWRRPPVQIISKTTRQIGGVTVNMTFGRIR